MSSDSVSAFGPRRVTGPVRRVAVVGAGCSGLTVAILLREGGIDVDLVESRSDPAAVGSGIMLQANALRVLRRAGVWAAVEAAGYGFDSTGIRSPDPTGRLVAELTAGRFDPDLPATLALPRADLAAILLDRALALGVRVHLATVATALRPSVDGVELDVRGPAGLSTCAFDLVVGADGVHSTIRRLIGISTGPRPLDLGVWRAYLPRPASVNRSEIINGGPAYFAGYAPMSGSTLYAWLVEDAADRRTLTAPEQVAIFRALAAGYHGPWDEIRASLTAETPVNYTLYNELLLPLPWHRGRTVLIGDAAHSCPPTMAQGAALALEDAQVLAETVLAAGADDAALTAYGERRMPRVRPVVEGSVQLVQWQLAHERGDAAALVGAVSRMLAQPV